MNELILQPQTWTCQKHRIELSDREPCPQCRDEAVAIIIATANKIKENIMHYGNGREAKNGDKVMLASKYGAPRIGVLYDAVPGNDACNGRIATITNNDTCPDLRECFHIDDVMEAVKILIPDDD